MAKTYWILNLWNHKIEKNDIQVLKKSDVEREIESFEDEKLKWLDVVDDYNNPKKVKLIRKEDWEDFKNKLLGSEMDSIGR